jgi:arginase
MHNQTILTPFFLDRLLVDLEELASRDWIINKPDLTGSDIFQRLSTIHRSLAEFTRQTIESGERPVSIGGDCCTAMGVVAGLQSAGIDPYLIWFDAHGDFNTWKTTPSGFLGGMPLAMLVGRGDQTLIDALDIKPLSENRVWLTDGRDLDPEERGLIEAAQIHHLPEVKALAELEFPEMPVYVHIDTDIIDPDDAPAMNYPAKGGPALRDLHAIMNYLHRSTHITAVSISTWNPELDQDGHSRRVSLGLLDTLISGE